MIRWNGLYQAKLTGCSKCRNTQAAYLCHIEKSFNIAVLNSSTGGINPPRNLSEVQHRLQLHSSYLSTLLHKYHSTYAHSSFTKCGSTDIFLRFVFPSIMDRPSEKCIVSKQPFSCIVIQETIRYFTDPVQSHCSEQSIDAMMTDRFHRILKVMGRRSFKLMYFCSINFCQRTVDFGINQENMLREKGLRS